ncbi:MAG: type 1 glutamine amidotransferase domain-containing protein [Pseudomonadota bacterium]
MKNVLIIATDGFEQSELMDPKSQLEDAGISVKIASLDKDDIDGWDDGHWGESVAVDLTVDEVNVDEYDALLLPGGQINPDVLRMNDRVIETIQEFNGQSKPIAAICHAPWLLAEADIIAGKVVTSWPSLRTDLRNAGGDVVDRQVAVDGNIITSRNPDDIPAFTNALLDALTMNERVSENA